MQPTSISRRTYNQKRTASKCRKRIKLTMMRPTKLSSLYNCLANGAPLAYFDYQYDAASRITGCRREDGTQIYYQYDPASRLTRETWYESAAMQPIYSFAWDYDLAGNRIYQNYNDRQTYYFYNPGNTLIRKQEQGEAPVYYHYDNRGNCTIIQESDGSSYFSYNYANLVTDIRFKSGVSNYFFYDSRLRRYALQDSDGLRYFTWDAGGLNLLYEKDASGNVVAEYTHGYTPVAGIGSLVAARRMLGGLAITNTRPTTTAVAWCGLAMRVVWSPLIMLIMPGECLWLSKRVGLATGLPGRATGLN